MPLLDDLLSGLRDYAARRDLMNGYGDARARERRDLARGATAFDAQTPAASPDVPLPAGIDATGVVGGPQVYDEASGRMMPIATDPYAPADADLAAKRASTMPNGSPIPYAGMLNSMGVLGAPGAGGAAPAAAGTPDESVFESGAAPIVAPGLRQTVGLASRIANPTGEVETPVAARPIQHVPETLPPATPPGEGFLSRISNALASNPSTLLALGAGFAGAPNFGQGMSRAFAAAVPASKQDQAMGVQKSQISATYSALVGMGVSPQEALAAAYNPDVMKALTQRLFGMNATWGVVGHDEYGNPKYGFINNALQTVIPGEKVTTPRVANFEEALRLPKGQHFIDPYNVPRIR